MNKITKKLIFGAAAFLIIGGTIISCKKGTTVTPPAPIGGFNNSNEVGAAFLKAHWTFDGTNSETISGIAPITSVGNSFGTGVKGQCLF